MSLVEPQDVLVLPELPYDYDSLTPHLDSATLRVHHQGHHKAYTDKTNAALAQWRQEVRMYCFSIPHIGPVQSYRGVFLLNNTLAI